MQVIGINGSPRKQWNTATLVAKALEGAAAQGAETELVHLYDLGETRKLVETRDTPHIFLVTL